MKWNDLNWVELSWVELSWVELSWIGLDWIGLDWIKWIELNWIQVFKHISSVLNVCLSVSRPAPMQQATAAPQSQWMKLVGIQCTGDKGRACRARRALHFLSFLPFPELFCELKSPKSLKGVLQKGVALIIHEREAYSRGETCCANHVCFLICGMSWQPGGRQGPSP